MVSATYALLSPETSCVASALSSTLYMDLTWDLYMYKNDKVMLTL